MPYKVESRTFRDTQMRDGRDVAEYLDDKEAEGWDLVGIMRYGFSDAFSAFVFKKRERTDAAKNLEKQLAGLRETLANVEVTTKEHSDRDVLPYLVDKEYACEDPIKPSNKRGSDG